LHFCRNEFAIFKSDVILPALSINLSSMFRYHLIEKPFGSLEQTLFVRTRNDFFWTSTGRELQSLRIDRHR
jgi:hypothetical protein